MLKIWGRQDQLLAAMVGAGVAMAALGAQIHSSETTIAGLVIAAVGGVWRLGDALWSARREEQRQAKKARRRLRVPVAKIADVDPTQIGVDRAEQHLLRGEGIPEYVGREIDAQLREAVAAALAGNEPWIVVVQGAAKVGKSRSLFEALKSSTSARTADLVAPANAAALEELLASGEVPPKKVVQAVLWLDDLEPFINDGMTWQTLCEWRGSGPTRIVAATHGGKGNALAGAAQKEVLAPVAEEIFQRARAVGMERTVASELTVLQGQIGERERKALEHYGLAAYFVAGPALERKLSTGLEAVGATPCPEGVALVYAVVDWARCGRTDPMPQETLEELWPTYLLPGEAGIDLDFEQASAWALTSVTGSIALVSRTDGYQAFDLVIRLVNDGPHARPVRAECWTAAAATATGAQALAVGVSAYSSSNLEVAREVLDRARASSVAPEVAASAGLSLGVVLDDLGNHDAAIEAYDDVITRFGQSSEPALCEQVARALYNKGITLGERGMPERAVTLFAEIVRRFGSRPEPVFQEQVARAMYSEGVTRGELGDPSAERAAYAEVIARFGQSDRSAILESVAQAMYSQGVMQGERDNYRAELDAYEKVVARFGQSDRSAILETVAKAMYNTGVALAETDRPEAAISAYGELADRFNESDRPAMLEQMAKAMYNAGAIHAELGRPDDAITAYDALIARFAQSDDHAVREQVAKAAYSRAAALSESGRTTAAIEAYSGIVEGFGADSDPAVREQVAKAMYNLGVVRAEVGERDGAITAYDELITRFALSDVPAVREQVAKAMYNLGVVRAEVGERDGAIEAYSGIVQRFDGDPEPALREQVAKAMYNLGVVRAEVGERDGAIEAYSGIVQRFGGDPEAALRDIVARARVAVQRSSPSSGDRQQP